MTRTGKGRRTAAALAAIALLHAPALAQRPQGGAAGGGHGTHAGGTHAGGAHAGGAHAGGAHAGHHAGTFHGGRIAPPPGGVPRSGHFTGPHGTWSRQPAWRGGGEFTHWRHGHWWRGNYGGRYGAWWVVGPDWYWYPRMIAPIPDPYTPPGMAMGYWYWCDAYRQYYPYVGACPTGWRAVAPQ